MTVRIGDNEVILSGSVVVQEGEPSLNIKVLDLSFDVVFGHSAYQAPAPFDPYRLDSPSGIGLLGGLTPPLHLVHSPNAVFMPGGNKAGRFEFTDLPQNGQAFTWPSVALLNAGRLRLEARFFIYSLTALQPYSAKLVAYTFVRAPALEGQP